MSDEKEWYTCDPECDQCNTWHETPKGKEAFKGYSDRKFVMRDFHQPGDEACTKARALVSLPALEKVTRAECITPGLFQRARMAGMDIAKKHNEAMLQAMQPTAEDRSQAAKLVNARRRADWIARGVIAFCGTGIGLAWIGVSGGPVRSLVGFGFIAAVLGLLALGRKFRESLTLREYQRVLGNRLQRAGAKVYSGDVAQAKESIDAEGHQGDGTEGRR